MGMHIPHQSRPQGVRSDRFSGSKFTNLTPYNPFYSALEKVYSMHEKDMERCATGPFIRAFNQPAEFIMPLTINSVRQALARVRPEFLSDLKGVFLMAGTRKMAKTFKASFAYGVYGLNCIFIFPYPRSQMNIHFSRQPKPSYLQEFKRVGAEVIQEDSGVTINFTVQSLEEFYLRDVLMHELGHHVDRHSGKDHRRSEAFAEWFALEYGLKHTA
jgi:hypothetical protein